jgi:FkbM family methyltransferase
MGKQWRKMRWRLLQMGPPRDVTTATANGILTFSSRDRVIGQQLYLERSYETELMRTALAILREEGLLGSGNTGTVVDVGANIGMICIALVKDGYFQRAIAFEPAPENYRLLLQNIRQNGLQERIAAFPCALSCDVGWQELELSEVNAGDHRIRHANLPGELREDVRRTLPVSVTTLDEFLRKSDSFPPEGPSLIWLDIQGHEGQFLAGARESLARPIPVVSEFWPYGILRSGMPRREYSQIVRGLFTHFSLLGRDGTVWSPIAELDELFDVYSGSDRFCQIVLLRRS